MATESAPQRPRTSLLVLLGIVLVAAFAVWMRGDSADPAPRPSNPGRTAAQPRGRQTAAVDPADLDLRLEALKTSAPQPGDSERNPFRFQPKAPPPPPPMEPRKPIEGGDLSAPPIERGPVPPPPIPLKFIGVVAEEPGVGKIAALTDCRHTVQGVEGDVIEGRYRIVKIGIESLVIEYLDGKGRTTLRMSGQDCVAR